MLFLGNFLYCQWTLIEPNPTNDNFVEKIAKTNFVKILDLRIFHLGNKLHENYSPCGDNSSLYCDDEDAKLINRSGAEYYCSLTVFVIIQSCSFLSQNDTKYHIY